MKHNYDVEYFQKSADYILDKVDFKPEIALILGSALGTLAEEIENPVVVDYNDIPGFLTSTVESHAGKLILGELSGKKVVCMSGRFHYYEGYDFEQLVTPIRVLHLLGVETVVLTNAAGGVNTSYNVGDIMIIEDHIKLMGASPL
ncbi:MAG: purine-nucleoside phosphorylase, partial [Tissierella sp.]|uniref:purine-nucleoside phosphorylase n=1 Tax=Tissierella sp. TaxID=41274 RepID=UPI003F9DB683